MNDDIVAICTANGIGSISIIRLSGQNSLKIAMKFLKIKDLKPRYAKLCNIHNLDNEFIDEGIVLYFKSPNSFTGEDIVEFQIHGGNLISEILLEELIRAGARLARPGEFSQRAYINNKMDLSKATAIQALINAKSQSAFKILSRQMQGELQKFVDDLRENLILTLAFVEVNIDYSDDDLPHDLLTQINEMIDINCEKLEKIVNMSRAKKGIFEGFKIAIIGKPNVGKSSILNNLLGKDRAIVSDIKGTTRDAITENLKIGTHLVSIIDTAGIRQDASYLEKIGIEYSLKISKEADVILAVFDASNSFDEQDKEILKLISNFDKKIFYILNKSDLGRVNFDLDDVILISTKDFDGSRQAILSELEKYLNTQDSSEMILSSNLQILECENALNALKRSLNLLSESELELFAYEINLALRHIGNITKGLETSEILDAMFSSFCLGK